MTTQPNNHWPVNKAWVSPYRYDCLPDDLRDYHPIPSDQNGATAYKVSLKKGKESGAYIMKTYNNGPVKWPEFTRRLLENALFTQDANNNFLESNKLCINDIVKPCESNATDNSDCYGGTMPDYSHVIFKITLTIDPHDKKRVFTTHATWSQESKGSATTMNPITTSYAWKEPDH